MLDKRQKEIGVAVENVAAESMSEALQEKLEVMDGYVYNFWIS